MRPELTAADHAAVFDHFAATPTEPVSCYPWSPVFPALRDGRPVVVKKTAAPTTAGQAIGRWTRGLAAAGTNVVVPLDLPVDNPAAIGDAVWVCYPWIAGRPYQATIGDIIAAGDLLGRIHGCAIPDTGVARFRWPESDPDEVDEDLGALRDLLDKHAPERTDELMARLEPLGRRFGKETLPAIREAALPVTEVSMDYKANNLVYTERGPVLVDPDNAERVPRLLDLALAVLLFHNEEPAAPGRLFTCGQWVAFREAYLNHVVLTDTERALWPVALRYMLWEWGTWTITDNGPEEWEDDRQRDFLLELAGTDEHAYPLD